MIKIDESATVKRPVSAVFDYVIDFPRWPEWRRTLHKASKTTEGPVAAGTRVAVEGQMMGRDISMDVEITDYVPNERIAFRTSAGPIAIDGEFRFEPEQDSTRLAVVGTAEPAGVFKMVGPMIARQVHVMWAEDLAALKGVLEG